MFNLGLSPISFPEAAILLVSDGDRDLWPGAGRVQLRKSLIHGLPITLHAQSQVWQIWLVLVSIYCVYTAIQNRNVVGPGQGSFQRMTKATPGDEVGIVAYSWVARDVIIFENPKLKNHQSYYLHQAWERVNLYLLKTFQRRNMLRLKAGTF